MTTDYALGFESVDREFADRELPVDGSVPSWLTGSLFRNGPAKFEVGDESVAHWFDGLAMLTRFAFDDGGGRYSNRFLRSEEYAAVTEAGRMSGSQFGTNRSGLLGAIRDLVVPKQTDNANVNVLRLGDRFVAITETPVGIEFDPSTLETVGQYRFDDLHGQMMTAHPHVDPHRRETVTMTTEFGRTSHYRFYRRSHDRTRFEPIGAVETPRPAYVHSFGLTANHVVLVEFPFDVTPLKLLLPGSDAFIERYEWRPETGTRFVVLDRESGTVVADRTHEAFFAFHHVNAFEAADGSVAVDIAAFDRPDVIDRLYLEDLRTGPLPEIPGELRRYRIATGSQGVDRDSLYTRGVTLPRIAPHRNTRPYRYVYAQGTPDPEDDLPQRLVKIDTRARSAVAWSEPDTYCGEPVFVPAPDRSDEDTGVVLSLVLEPALERSALLVLDGETFEERARLPLPHVVPFDFHGQFFPDP